MEVEALDDIKLIGPGVAAWDDFGPIAEAARSALKEAAGIVIPTHPFSQLERIFNFDFFGVPLHQGRLLSPLLDQPDRPPAAVVNEAFVKKFIPPGFDPTAQRIDSDPNPKNWTRIVGVVGNVRQNIYEPPLPEHDYLIDSMEVKANWVEGGRLKSVGVRDAF